LRDVPVLRETSSLDAKDIDDDPGRPATPAEAPVDHDVGTIGNGERAGSTAELRTVAAELPPPSATVP
jgi:hypothetical protein